MLTKINRLPPNLPKNILIITEVIYGSGDIYAAAKLIKTLGQNPDQKIHWLILRHSNRQDVAAKVADIQLELSGNTRIDLRVEGLLNPSDYLGTHLILLYPTVHYLSSYNFNQLKSLNVPILQVHEYDNMDSLHHLPYRFQLACVKSGFSGLGIFLEPVEQTKLIGCAQKIFPTNLNVFNQADRVTYFSYSPSLLDSKDASNDATFQNYYKIVIAITAQDQSVDIITNSDSSLIDRDLLQVAWDLDFSEVLFLQKQKDLSDYKTLFQRQSPRPTKKFRQLRLINGFPFSQQQMQAVMFSCHPLIQCTGDQSLSEVMSLGAQNSLKFPFYLTMFWKNDLYRNWLELCSALLGRKSKYVELLKMLAPGATLDSNAFVNVWKNNESAILAESQVLFQVINGQMNLYTNLPRFLSIVTKHSSQYAKLLVTLTAKLQNDLEIQEVIYCIENEVKNEQKESVINAMIEFLTLNVFPIKKDQLLHLVILFNNTPQTKRHYLALMARKIINLLPRETKEEFINKILPELARVSSELYSKIVSQLEEAENILLITQNPRWLGRAVEEIESSNNNSEEQHNKNKRIALTVDVWEGFGDVVKYIGMFKSLNQIVSVTSLRSLIRCLDEVRPTIIAMLRENNIPLNNVYFLSRSRMEVHASDLLGLEKSPNLYAKLVSSGFLDVGKFSLLISVATPFPGLYEALYRENPGIRYIELAEMNFVSFKENSRAKLRNDRHDFCAMGIEPDSIGLEITEPLQHDLSVLFASLSRSLANQLLDRDYSEDNVKEFLNDTFFFPAYIKYDNGCLSLKFAVQLMNAQFQDKRKCVLWLHEMPFDVNAESFLTTLKEKGFSSLVVFNNDQRKSVVLSNQSGKQLSIVCKQVSTADFDLMYNIARHTGGVAGCVGQNSFEKSLSLSLLPVFLAPSWQQTILYQCKAVIAQLFESTSKEGEALTQYFELLHNCSEFFAQKERILNPDFNPRAMDPYRESLLELSEQEHQYKMKEILEKNFPEALLLFPYAFMPHPQLQIEQFLGSVDLNLVKSAWQKVCAYVKAHKNLNSWLQNKVKEYLPMLIDLKQKEPVSPIKMDREAATFLLSYRYLPIANDFPALYNYVGNAFERNWQDFSRQGFQFYLSDCDSYFLDIMEKISPPRIMISAKLLSTLTVEEFIFNVKLIIARYKRFPVENGNYPLNNTSPEELLREVEDLESGISSCRKIIKQLKNLLSAQKQKNFKSNKEIIWDSQISFYSNMIKVIELKLAEKHKNNFGKTVNIIKTPMPEAIINEVTRQLASWQKSEQESKVTLQNLLDIIPGLKILNETEYTDPRPEVSSFLDHLINLKLDVSLPQVRQQLEQLIDLAFHHKFPLFDELYQTVCRKMGVRIIPLSIFKVLQRAIAKLIAAKSLDLAVQAADEIHHFLNDDSTKFLFYGRDSKRYGGLYSLTPLFGRGIDEIVRANIGGLIKWSDYIALDTTARARLVEFVKQDSSTLLATVLFLLGMVDEPTIWKKLTPDFIQSQIYTTTDIIGAIPKRYQLGVEVEGKSYLSRTFFSDFMLHICGGGIQTIENRSFDQSRIENFISANITALAHPEYAPAASQELMLLFREFLKENHQDVQRMIYDFFINRNYAFGLYALAKLRKSFRKQSAKFCQVSEGSYDDKSFYTNPYLKFFLDEQLPFISYDELLITLTNNFLVQYHLWPYSFTEKKLNLNITNLGDALVAFHELKKQFELVKRTYGRHYVEYALATMMSRCLKLPDVFLFSSKMFALLTNTMMTLLTQNQIIKQFWLQYGEQIFDTNCKIELDPTQLAQFYQISDQYRLFPNPKIRDRFSEILFNRTIMESAQLQLKIIDSLLLTSFPLSDVTLINKLIRQWVLLQAKTLGKDDDSGLYYRSIVQVLGAVVDRAPNIYRCKMLDELLCEVQAQKRVCKYVEEELNKSLLDKSLSELVCANDLIIKVINQVTKSGLSHELLDYLIFELSDQSLERILSKLKAESYQSLQLNYEHIDKSAATLIMICLYHQFWNLSLENRTVVINNLIIPSTKVQSDGEAKSAYSNALKILDSKLFPDPALDKEIEKGLLDSWLKAGHQYVRPFLLTALISATKLSGQSSDFIAVLPRLAEALGAVGVKVAQAVANSPFASRILCEAFAHLKSQTRIPFRWELFQLISERITPEIADQIVSVGRILGGASFYIAVEVHLKNGTSAVLRLLRKNVQQEIESGFNHLRATIESCKHPRVVKIYNDLKYILEEAKNSADMEVDDNIVKQQYKIGRRIYNDRKHTVKHNNRVYRITIKMVDLYHQGKGFQLISMAPGVQFSALKRRSQQKELCQVVSFAVCKTELENMLSDGPFDPDWHEGQCNVVHSVAPDGAIDVTITRYDVGEISPVRPTQAQLNHCKKFIAQIVKDNFSLMGLAREMLSSSAPPSAANTLDDLGEKVIEYIRIHRENTPKAESPGDDLARLRRMFKGLLALNDYFECLKGSKELTCSLQNDLMKLLLLPKGLGFGGIFGFFGSGTDQNVGSNISLYESPTL